MPIRLTLTTLTTSMTNHKAVALACACSAIAAFARAQEPAPVEATRAVMERWVETRSVIGKEKRDWQLGRELLDNRIALVQREIETMRTRIAEAAKNATDLEVQKAALAAENQRLVDGASSLSGPIAGLEMRTRRLLERLPEPLRERLKLLSQRLPEKPGETKLTLGERFLTVVGLLNEVNKFQREITVTSEVRTLGDGTSAEVTAVYVGLGQGYYVTADGKAAGTGAATPDVWKWTPNNTAGPSIRRVITILKNEQPAAFVPVPVKVQ